MAKKKPSPSSRDLIVGIVAQVYAVDSATLRDDTVISRLSKRTDLESLDRWTLMGELEPVLRRGTGFSSARWLSA